MIISMWTVLLRFGDCCSSIDISSSTVHQQVGACKLTTPVRNNTRLPGMGCRQSDVHFLRVQSKAKKFHDTLSWRGLSPQLSVSYLSTRPYHRLARATYGLVLDFGLLELSSLARVWPAGINMAPPDCTPKSSFDFFQIGAPDRSCF
jgi:hypothetical protein